MPQTVRKKSGRSYQGWVIIATSLTGDRVVWVDLADEGPEWRTLKEATDRIDELRATGRFENMELGLRVGSVPARIKTQQPTTEEKS